MAWPADLPLRTCSLGPDFGGVTGADLGVDIEVSATRPLMIWSTTGAGAFGDATVVTIEPGAAQTFPLPVTDATGWLLGGLPVDVSGGKQSHLYNIVVQPWRYDGSHNKSYASAPITLTNVAIPTGDGSTLDLDKSASISGATGGTVTVPDYVAQLEDVVNTAEADLAAVAAAPTDAFVAARVADSSSATAGALDARNDGRYVGRGAQLLTPEDFGAKGDGRTVTDAVLASNTTVTSASAAFTSADVGKRLVVLPAAGSSQATFATTISSVNSATSVTVAAAAPYSGSALEMTVATDDTAALQSWLSDARTLTRYLPGRIYGFTAGLALGSTYDVMCAAGSVLKVVGQIATPTGWPAGARAVPTAVYSPHANLVFSKRWVGGVIDTSNLCQDGLAIKWGRQFTPIGLQVRGGAAGGFAFIFGDDSMTNTSYQINVENCIAWRDFGVVPRASSMNGVSVGTGLALSAANDTVTATAHGLVNGQMVFLSSLSGGAGLLSNATYYVTAATTNTFKLATQAGVTGTTIDITTDGTATITAYPLALSVGFSFRESCTDSHVTGKTVSMGYQTGFETHGGDNVFGPSTHAWSRPSVGLMDYAFDDWIGLCSYYGTIADTPQLAGYRQRSTTNPSYYHGVDLSNGTIGGADNTVVGFVVDAPTAGHIIRDAKIHGADSSHRVLAAMTQPAGNVVAPRYPFTAYQSQVTNTGTDTAIPYKTNTQTSTAATLFSANHGQIVPLNNASPITFTIKGGVFSGGQWCKIVQLGTGQVTIAAGSGVTLRSRAGLKTTGQFSVATIIRDSFSETYYIEGDLSP